MEILKVQKHKANRLNGDTYGVICSRLVGYFDERFPNSSSTNAYLEKGFQHDKRMSKQIVNRILPKYEISLDFADVPEAM